MTFTVQGLNRVIYTNKTASSLDVTLGAAGAVVFDVNTPGAAVTRHGLPQQGGVISMTVAPNATIDANTNAQVGVQVEVLDVR